VKIKVLEIPEEGMTLEAAVSSETKPRDAWFKEVVEEAFGENFPKGNNADLDLHVLRTSDNVQMSGTARVLLKPSCDRCMETFDQRLDVPLHVNLAPHKDMNFDDEDSGDDEGLDEDDVAFSFYKGEEINVGEIVREMVLLDVPIRYLCNEDCKGLCAQCGKNLNTGACSCAKTAVDTRFAALKQLLKTTD
jgi:uncharacterized protein